MKQNNIFKNFGLKLLALFFSFGLWLVVVNISDPVATTTISGVPVEVLNGDEITSKGQIYEVLEGTDTITVSVSAKRTILDSINRDNIKATADLRNLSSNGTVRIKVESNRYSETIESIKSKTEYLKVNIEEMEKSQFAITPVVTGEPVSGYVVGNITLDENVVRVSGPKSVISQIDKAVAEVSVTNMSSNIRTSVELKLYDAQDNLIENRNITKNITNVNISAEILGTKEVALKLAVSGTPAEEYGLTGVLTSNPETILVAGNQAALSKVSEIEIPASEINVEGAIGEMNFAVNVEEYLPDGIRLVEEEQSKKIIVTVGIAEKEAKVIELDKNAVTITGVPEGYEATFSTGDATIPIEVMAMPKQLESLDASAISAVIDFAAFMKEKDMTKVNTISYTVPVTCNLPEGVTLKSPVNILIKISEKKD